MTLSASPSARRHARDRWGVLKDRLQTIRPEALGRGLLAGGIVGLSAWLAIASWPALLPFVFGAVIAYAVLPICNRLNRFMPRWLAAVLAELVALALVVGVLVIIVPPLIASVIRVIGLIPTQAQIQQWIADGQAQIGTLPEPMRTVVLSVATQVSANFQSIMQSAVDGLAAAVTQQMLGVLDTASNVLGLLVIPAWILTVVADERNIKQRALGYFAPAIRADIAALFRIVDRGLGTFLRVRVLLGVVTAFNIAFAYWLAETLGADHSPYALAAAVMLGVLQLIPEIGYYLGFFPILLVLVISGPISAGIAALIYIVSVRVASGLVETRVSRGVLDVHPGLLIPAIVVLSQFGLIWLIAAAPVIAIGRDTVRYLNGRLGDPPAPAGVLPGERTKRRQRVQAAQHVPSTYRTPTPAASSAATPTVTSQRSTVS